MSVSELIEELKKHPLDAKVFVVYDSDVCWCSVEKVVFAFDHENPEKLGVGLLEESSVYARENP